METENKAVLISIQPKWCELIASGRKTVEVRKTKPKLKLPFKCYIYCTKDKDIHFWTGKRYSYADDHSHNAFDKDGNGKVIGEFVCDRIDTIDIIDDPVMTYIRVNQLNQHADICITAETCLNINQLQSYLNDQKGYGWHISDLKIYDEPKELSKFSNKSSRLEFSKTQYGFPWKWSGMSKPPQSWCYVEEG